MAVLERAASSHTLSRLQPSVRTKGLLRRHFPMTASRTSGPVAVFDLRLLAGRRGDHGTGDRSRRAAQAAHETSDAGVAGPGTVIVNRRPDPGRLLSCCGRGPAPPRSPPGTAHPRGPRRSRHRRIGGHLPATWPGLPATAGAARRGSAPRRHADTQSRSRAGRRAQLRCAAEGHPSRPEPVPAVVALRSRRWPSPTTTRSSPLASTPCSLRPAGFQVSFTRRSLPSTEARTHRRSRHTRLAHREALPTARVTRSRLMRSSGSIPLGSVSRRTDAPGSP